MNPKTEAAAIEHAVAEFPRESCGVVIVVKGKEQYVACRNMADTAMENFILSAEDYANAEDQGEVVAIVHSHPNAANRMSEADRVMCNASSLPWYIVSVIDGVGGVARYEPDDYVAPLVGRTFVHGVLDCYSLVRDYYQRELNIVLPDFERRDNWWNNGADLYMQHFRDAGFDVIRGAVQKHDVIIMQMQADVANHAGVYIGDGQMLHHVRGRLSTRDVYGGWFQEITRVIVRHRELNQ